MILEHKYWVFKNGVSPYICDEILRYVEEKKTLKEQKKCYLLNMA